ncbi:MAG: diaminopimelate decarboxylase family protein, partial [Nitrospinota bacterium]
MHYFHYKEGTLHCEEVPIRKIVEAVGTPLYIYSHRTLERHFRAFQDAFREVPHLVCFSVKANSHLAVLRTFINLGGGLDVVSGGELFRGLQAGVDPEKVVFAGVGKSEAEIGYALRKGVLMFNVESGEELSAIEDVARRMGCVARVALRVNPDVDPQTHPYIATGLKRSK